MDWPDGRASEVTGLAANQLVTIRQADAGPRRPRRPLNPHTTLLTDVTDRTALDFKHHENDFVDFDREPLMPKLVSTEGPFIAVGDVNGDGLDDIFIGGAKGQASRLFIQQRDGRFVNTDEAVFARRFDLGDAGRGVLRRQRRRRSRSVCRERRKRVLGGSVGVARSACT